MSSPTADGGILDHLERLIAAAEARASKQTAKVMALIGTVFDSRGEKEALWRTMGNLLALRR